MQGKKYATPNLSRNSQRRQGSFQDLPTIPDKRYFTMSEASLLCGVKPHVLRYWEQEFPQLNPTKRRGNRRYYQYNDILLVRQIRALLYENGFTIEGARAKLVSGANDVGTSVKTDAALKKMIADLEGLLQQLQSHELA